MRQKTLWLVPFFFYIFIFGCKKTEIASQWQNRTMKIDGDNTDWENTAAEYLKDPNAAVSISNDEQNLYVLFRFSDENLARKILSRGLLIYFNKDEKSGIRYRGNFALAESLRSIRTRQNQSPKTNQPNFPAIGNLGMIGVFNQNNKELLRENNDAGPKAAALFRDGVFSYEFSIPIELIANSDENAKLGFEISGIDRNRMKKIQQQRPSMGGRSDGMGGRGSGMSGREGEMGDRGGKRGGRTGRDFRYRSNMAPQEVWIHVQLATDE
ncbi:MAG: hypothetical protein GXO75_19845 [Calditrichaeota bacterium]|nr:hypothetical protein [Calditrichota bacterium]